MRVKLSLVVGIKSRRKRLVTEDCEDNRRFQNNLPRDATLSVCLSETKRYGCHIGLNTSKIISRLINLGLYLL